jgi:hypothetical protein
MKAKQLLLAAIHPRLPIEGELPSLGSATEWLIDSSRSSFSIREWRLMRSRSADPWQRLFTHLPREKPFLETGLPVLGSFGT